MQRAEPDRIRIYALRVAFSALFSLAYTTQSFAQSEPPLDVPRADVLSGLASSGCDVGLSPGPGGYGNAGLPKTTDRANVGNNSASDLGVPLYSTPDAGTNLPLYSNPLAGDNVPLYSTPNPGSNAPLYSNSSLYGSSTYGNSGLSGGYNSGSGANPAANVSPVPCHSGIPVGEWLLYPSVRLYSIYSDNFFLSPIDKLNVWDFGVTPSVTAEWSNGIHTTTIFANVDTQRFPTQNLIDTFDRQATFTQKYAPLPDLTVTALGDYTHKTITSSLTSAIPAPITTGLTGPTILPNGDIELPNGNIFSPTGQFLGNINGSSAPIGVSLTNPYDQYTATATATKVFNRGILTLSASAAQTDYQFTQNSGSTAFTAYTSKTFRENGSFWLGPVIYAYSTGSFSMRNQEELVNPNSDAYKVEGGLGTRQFGLFRSSIYFGYQGANSDGAASTGGLTYGGKISYYPTLAWTITAGLDETINHAPLGAAASNLALNVNAPEQIPLSSSTRITTASLQSQYQISSQWSATGNFSYTQIDFYGSPELNNDWQVGATLNYEIWRNMTLSWEYQYTDILSNVPGNSARRNFVMMSANYRF